MAEDWLKGMWMQTYTGKKFYPMRPKPEDIDIKDIAHALSLLCRYNGHVKKFYSVAEHCVLMSEKVPPEDALWALLHDATEAYVGDMIRPLKVSMPNYVAAEQRVMDAITTKFGLSPTMPASVKEADKRILFTERNKLMAHPPVPWAGEEDIVPLDVKITGYSAKTIEGMYLARFHKLTEVVPRAKYILYPSTVRSQKDGDLHFIDYPTLVKLYGLNPAECISSSWSEGYDLTRLVHLFPRPDGNYALS